MISLRNRKQNLNEKQKNKIIEIKEALKNNDINGLRNLSRTEGGFVTSELRKLCWPFLLHVDVSEIRISDKDEIISKINEALSSSNDNENETENENEQQNSVEEQSTDSKDNVEEKNDIKVDTIPIVDPEKTIQDNSNEETNNNEDSNNIDSQNIENTENVEKENSSNEAKQETEEQEKQNEQEKIEKEPIEISDNNENEQTITNENNETITNVNNNVENNETEVIKKEEVHEIQDDFNSETLKDENNENIENITQENIVLANNIDDNTENNHTDNDDDDVLYEGDLDVKLSDVHSSYYEDNEENRGIFDSSCSSLNLLADVDEKELKENEETKKIIAKNLILDDDNDNDPDRVDKLKQIENESKYRDKRQIMLDVNRAFVHFPKGLKAKEKTTRQIELSNVIMYSLKDHSYLHYYQGYHDICSLLLLVLGEDIAKPCAEILALYWLREYMKETLEPTLEVMSLLYPILKHADPKIYKLVYNNMVPPYFSISWVITWCIHDLRDTNEMERIFDFFISNNPIMPIYFAAAVILAQKEQLYKRFPQILNENAERNVEDENDPETSMPNFSVVHQFLTNLLPIATQTKDVTVDGAVELAWNLYEQYPLSFLMKKEKIKLNSLCCVKRYFDDCEKILPNVPFNKEEIVKLLKEEERINLEKTMASPNSKNDHLKKIQEKADIIGNYLTQRITLWTIATTLILVTAIILTHEFLKSYYV